MKKRLLAILMLAIIALTACAGETNKESALDGKLTIGIVQYIEHPALDAAREGFIEAVKNSGIDAEFDYQSAQGTIDVARTISEKFVSDNVDLIFAIGTPAAQAASSVTQEIPIIFSAVTDAVDSELVETNEKPGGNVTGTSDLPDVDKQLELFNEIDENIKTIGVIYSADEANSEVQLNIVKDLAPKKGLEVEAISIQNISDLPQAAQSIAKKVDAVYVFSDNKIASSIALLADVLTDNKIPSVGAEEAHVEEGILMTDGILYFSLGEQAGEMVKRILIDGENPGEIPVETSKAFTKKVNRETLEILGLNEDLEVFDGAEFID